MWQGIIGHDNVVEHFRRMLAAGRMASTYLFVGPPGIGKRRFAVELAHALLCTEAKEESLTPCGQCESCRVFAAGSHPDLDVVGLRPDKADLAISQFVGFDDELKQEGLCNRIALKPFFGRRRIAIIDDADHFNQSSANALLKTLEEPPPSALLILIATSPSRQLPTIRSRSQVVWFRPLENDVVAQILLDAGVVAEREFALRVAGMSEGSVERAMQLADPVVSDFRIQITAALGAQRIDSVRLARAIQAFVDEAGKEPAQKRERLKCVISFAVEHYRLRLRDTSVRNSDAVIGQLDACLTALEQIDRNANVGLIIQAMCEEIAARPGLSKAAGTHSAAGRGG